MQYDCCRDHAGKKLIANTREKTFAKERTADVDYEDLPAINTILTILPSKKVISNNIILANIKWTSYRTWVA